MSFGNPFSSKDAERLKDDSVSSSVAFTVNKQFSVNTSNLNGEYLILFVPGRNTILGCYKRGSNKLFEIDTVLDDNNIVRAKMVVHDNVIHVPVYSNYKAVTNHCDFRLISGGFRLHNVGRSDSISGRYEMFDLHVNNSIGNWSFVKRTHDESLPVGHCGMLPSAKYVNTIIGDDYTQHSYYVSGNIKELEDEVIILNSRSKLHNFVTNKDSYLINPRLNDNVEPIYELEDSWYSYHFLNDLYDFQYYIKCLYLDIDKNQNVLFEIKYNYEISSDNSDIMRHKEYSTSIVDPAIPPSGGPGNGGGGGGSGDPLVTPGTGGKGNPPRGGSNRPSGSAVKPTKLSYDGMDSGYGDDADVYDAEERPPQVEGLDLEKYAEDYYEDEEFEDAKMPAEESIAHGAVEEEPRIKHHGPIAGSNRVKNTNFKETVSRIKTHKMKQKYQKAVGIRKGDGRRKLRVQSLPTVKEYVNKQNEVIFGNDENPLSDDDNALEAVAKETFAGIKDIAEGIVKGGENLLTSPIDAVVNEGNDLFVEPFEEVEEHFEELNDHFRDNYKKSLRLDDGNDDNDDRPVRFNKRGLTLKNIEIAVDDFLYGNGRLTNTLLYYIKNNRDILNEITYLAYSKNNRKAIYILNRL